MEVVRKWRRGIALLCAWAILATGLPGRGTAAAQERGAPGGESAVVLPEETAPVYGSSGKQNLADTAGEMDVWLLPNRDAGFSPLPRESGGPTGGGSALAREIQSVPASLYTGSYGNSPVPAAALPDGASGTIVGTQIQMHYSGGVATLSGSGTVANGLLREFADSIHTVKITGNVTVGDGAFADMTKLATVSIAGNSTAIGVGAFLNCPALKKVTISAAITQIGEGAFYHCTALQTVALPASVTEIGSWAFEGCTSLTDFSAPGVKELGEGVFFGCTGLKTFAMPETLTATGGSTFLGCSNLETVTLSPVLAKIGDYDFCECHALTGIVLPDSVTEIGEGAFYNCSQLRTIRFPAGYVDVGSYAFSFCNNAQTLSQPLKLRNVGHQAFIATDIPGNLVFSGETTAIGAAAFQGCKSLTGIDFGGAAVAVDSHAFFDCPNLTMLEQLPVYTAVGEAAFHRCAAVRSVTFADDCTLIGDGCFYDCDNLTTVDFQNTSAAIGSAAFYRCDALKTVTLSPNCPEVGPAAFYECGALSGVDFAGAAATVRDHAFASCEDLERLSGEGAVTGLGDFAFSQTAITDASGFAATGFVGRGTFNGCTRLQKALLPEGITVIPEYLFFGCEALKTLSLPDSATEIQAFAFTLCGSLKLTALPTALRSIGEGAFAECDTLTSLQLPEGLETIGDHAFSQCDQLRSFTGGKGVGSIGKQAFSWCTSLRTANFPGAVTVGDYAFNCCGALTAAAFSDALETLGMGVFAECTALSSFSIPRKVTFLGNSAFYNCRSLKTAVLPEGLKTLDIAAFYGCSALTEIDIPDTVQSIGASCFKDCTSLETAALPQSLRVLEDGVFYNCGALSGVEMPENLTQIGYGSFFGCKALSSLALAPSLIKIGDFAFTDCSGLESLELPKALRSIGEYAFCNCSGLKTMAVPVSVTQLENYLFYGCDALESVKCYGKIAGIGTGAFHGCASLGNLYLYGGAPALIGDQAFGGTPDTLVLHSTSLDGSWTVPQWSGPDDVTYRTALVEPDIRGACADVEWSYYSASGDLVISGNGRMADYTREQDTPWYPYIDDIHSVHIRDGVTYIGQRAFAGCTMLRSVYMADSVSACGDYAFAMCENLAYAQLSGGLMRMGGYAFYNCKALSDLTLPAGLTEIGSYAFFGCAAIQGIQIPDSVTVLGEGAFYNCAGLRSVVLSCAMTEVADYTFKGCAELECFLLGGQIRRIGKSAFADCGKLEYGCAAAGALEIGDYAFSGCEALKALHCTGGLPASAGYRAFRGVPEDFVIRYSLTSQPETGLTSRDGTVLTCLGAAPSESGSCGTGSSWYFFPETGLLYAAGSGELSGCEENQAPWNGVREAIRWVVIGDGITAVGRNLFAHSPALERVLLPDGLKTIGEHAFADCVSLRSIRLPDSLTGLGEGVFSHCSALSGIEVPAGVTRIPDYAFALCEQLERGSIPSGVTAIGYGAFYSCGSLSSLTLPDTVTEIQAWAFARCGKLEQVTARRVRTLGEYAFFHCDSLTDSAVLQNLTEVPAYAFAGTAVSHIALSDAVTVIGEGAFWGCGKLRTVSLGSVAAIGEKAFFESALESVTIPARTESIGAYAFGRCAALAAIQAAQENGTYFAEDGILFAEEGRVLVQYPIGNQASGYSVPAGVTRLEDGAFAGSRLVSVELPSGVAELGDGVFAGSALLAQADLPGTLTVIPGDTFRGCASLSELHFGGNPPKEIGVGAFADTPADLRFIVPETASGWTVPQWTGPDGAVYVVEIAGVVPFLLTAGESRWDAEAGTLAWTADIANQTQTKKQAGLWTAVYQDGRLLALEKREISLSGDARYQTDISLSGGLADGMTVKVFLLDNASLVPLTPALTLTCAHTAGEGTPLLTIGALQSLVNAVTVAENRLAEAPTESGAALSMALQLTHTDLDRAIGQSARKTMAGIDFTLSREYAGTKETARYTTKLSASGFDSQFGFLPGGMAAVDSGYIPQLPDSGTLPLSFAQTALSSESRRAVALETGDFSQITTLCDQDTANRIAFQSGGETLFSLRAMGYSAGGDTTLSQWREDGSFVFAVPYNGLQLLVTLQAQALVDKLRQEEALSSATRFAVSLQVTDETGAPAVLCAVEIAAEETGAVQQVTLTELAQYGGDGVDRTYDPARYDESVAATEDMKAEVHAISPQKGANGMVTVKVEGTRLEAGAEVSLSNGTREIPAERIYWFDHSKLYATFDLTDVPDGVYTLLVGQKTSVACTQSFTVDSSLPRGQLTAGIHVDKTVKPGKEAKGSLTYTNTGYTDVYAPVVLIDCGNIAVKGQGAEDFTMQETVFVPNGEGLAGILANGETAAYNFTYKVSTSKGFVMNVYNYAELTENVADPIVLTEASTASDVVNYNMFALTGIQARDYAESIARMACAQAALGETNLELEYLRNAYLSEAQGTLAGDTLVETTDLVSRDLSLNRYYYTDVTAHHREGLWGPGWFSDYDVTAEFHPAQAEDEENSIIIRNAAGMAVYTQKNGVYTEIAYGLSTALRDAGGTVVTYEDGSKLHFRADGKLSTITDVYGGTVTLEYNADGKLTKLLSDSGDSLVLTYAEGRLTAVTSPVTGDTVSYYYSDNRLVGTIDAYGKVIYGYSEDSTGGRKNALTEITSRTGACQRFGYDKLGRVVSVSNGEGTAAYDYPGGNVLRVTLPSGDVSTLSFSAAGKLVRTVDPAGNVSESAYSDLLLSSGIRYGLFNSFRYEYDSRHNLTRVTDTEGHSVSYDHDDRGNITRVTDRAGSSTAYERSTAGDIQKLIYADGKYESYTYDEKGNVTAAVKRDGTAVTFAYDDWSRLTQARFASGEVIRYAYDDRGNVTEIDENGAVTRMTYNSRGDLTGISYPNGTSLDYLYDEFGRVVGTESSGSFRVGMTYTYDAMDRLTQVSSGDTVFVSYAYNSDGTLRRQTNHNGTYTDYTYGGGYLKEIRNCKADGTTISFFRYTHDDSGNIAAVTDGSGTWTYGYDKLGQLTRVTDPGGAVTVYTYDLAGNRSTVVTGDTMVNYSANAMNQYTSAGSAQLRYDANGNLISRQDEAGTTLYAYDYLDRLVQVTQADGTVTSYTYDAFGNRDGVTVNGETTFYLNTPTGEGYPLVSYNRNTVEAIYVQGNGLAGQLRYDPQTGALPYYTFLYNHLGSTTEITDGNGNVVNRYSYDAEGHVTSATEGIGNNLTYVGRYGIADDGNGLYYARARYISQDTMSFLSPDPIGQDGDLNVYRYAGNDYVNIVDLTGLFGCYYQKPTRVNTGPAGADFLTWSTTEGKLVCDWSINVNLPKLPEVKFSEIKLPDPSFAKKVKEVEQYYGGDTVYEAIKSNRILYRNNGNGRWDDKNRGATHTPVTYEEYVNMKYDEIKGPKKNGVFTGGAAGISLEDVLPEYVAESAYSGNTPTNASLDTISSAKTGVAGMTEGLFKYMKANNIPFDENFTIIGMTGDSLTLGPADFNTPGSEWGLIGLLGNWLGWF